MRSMVAMPVRLVSSLRCGWGFVDQRPKNPELTDRRNELLEIHRFYNISVGPELVPFHQVGFFPGRGEDHDRKGTRFRVTANLSQRLEPIDARHLQVEQDNGRRGGRTIAKPVAAMQKIQRLGLIAHTTISFARFKACSAVRVSSTSFGLSSARRMGRRWAAMELAG